MTNIQRRRFCISETRQTEILTKRKDDTDIVLSKEIFLQPCGWFLKSSTHTKNFQWKPWAMQNTKLKG